MEAFTSIICFVPWETILSHLSAGFFGVVGGAVPLVFILIILFFRTRKSFRDSIPDERRLIGEYEGLLDQERTYLNTLNEQIENGQVTMSDEVFSYRVQLQNGILEKQKEILLRNLWIEKVENATFFGWVGYYFSKSYFGDYFRR